MICVFNCGAKLYKNGNISKFCNLFLCNIVKKIDYWNENVSKMIDFVIIHSVQLKNYM